MQKKPDSRDLLYLQFVNDRMHGHLSDEQIANKLSRDRLLHSIGNSPIMVILCALRVARPR